MLILVEAGKSGRKSLESWSILESITQVDWQVGGHGIRRQMSKSALKKFWQPSLTQRMHSVHCTPPLISAEKIIFTSACRSDLERLRFKWGDSKDQRLHQSSEKTSFCGMGLRFSIINTEVFIRMPNLGLMLCWCINTLHVLSIWCSHAFPFYFPFMI